MSVYKKPKRTTMVIHPHSYTKKLKGGGTRTVTVKSHVRRYKP